jgi:hypothetical protein
MFNTSSFRIADAGIDPKAVARSARDLSLPDAGEFLRRVDVPAHVDAAMEMASEAARGVIERLPGERRPRRRLPILVAAVSLGVLTAVGLAAWAMRRRAADIASRDRVEDMEFDRDALDRAANEGMSDVPGGDDAPSHSNGEVRELSAIGDLV